MLTDTLLNPDQLLHIAHAVDWRPYNVHARTYPIDIKNIFSVIDMFENTAITVTQTQFILRRKKIQKIPKRWI